MVIVIEGISAAGKTTWCDRHAGGRFVAELPAMSPPVNDPHGAAEFWVEAHCRRWAQAEQIEAELGRAYCDTDPIKLHYAWCLWRIGDGPKDDFLAAAAAYRDAVTARRVGFADAVVFLEPDLDVVRRQKEMDGTRKRRNFERHLKIGPALREWYEIIEKISPGRVHFNGQRLSDIESADHSLERFSISLFDAIVAMATRIGN